MTAHPAAVRPAPPATRLARGWWTAACIVLIPVLIPPISLLIQAIGSRSDVIIPTGRLAELLGATLALTVAVTITALSIGTTTAWLATATALPFARFWMILAAMPLVIPSYIAALSVIGATGPNGLLTRIIGVTIPTPYGFFGAWIALSVILAPMAHLIITPALRMIDPATEEAAIGLGSSRMKTFFTITLPQLRPALLSAALMVGLYTISDFGAVSLLRFDTFTRAIYTLYQGQIDRGPAQTLSAILMVIALIILFGERRVRGRARLHSTRPKRERSRLILNHWQGRMAAGFLAGYGTISLALPAAVLTYWMVRGLMAGERLPGVWAEAGRSISVSAVAALIAAAAALPVAMVTVRRATRASAMVESSVWAAYAIPHIAIGVAVVGFALAWARPLYQTTALLVATYLAMFLAQSMSTTQDSIRRLNPGVEEASRGLGHSQVSTLLRITLPIVRPGMVAGAALVFIGVIKELPATLLLRPNGFETLAVRIWSATGEGFLTRASFAGLILVALSIVPLFLVTVRDLRD